jgi:hypothetical protein
MVVTYTCCSLSCSYGLGYAASVLLYGCFYGLHYVVILCVNYAYFYDTSMGSDDMV